MAANLMGFQKVSKMPVPRGHSIYDPLLDEVRRTGGIYTLDTHDRRRAYSLANTIREVIKKRGYGNLTVGLRETTVWVRKS